MFKRKTKVKANTQPLTLVKKQDFKDKSKGSRGKSGNKISFKHRLVNALMILTIGLATPVMTAVPAQANWFGDAVKETICGDIIWADGTPGVSTTSILDAGIDVNHEGGKQTILEKFTFSGIQFTSWIGPWDLDEAPTVLDGFEDDNDVYSAGSNCIKPMRTFSVNFANAVLGVTKTVTWVNIMGVQYSIGDETLNTSVAQTVEQQITGLPAGTEYNHGEAGANLSDGAPTNGKGLRSIYATFSIIAIMIAGLKLGHIWYIKRQGTEAIKYLFLVVMLIGLSILGLGKPSSMMAFGDGVTDEGGNVLATMLENVSDAGGNLNNYCGVDATDGTVKEQIVRKVSCILYYTAVYQPWEQGQFGGQSMKNVGEIGSTVDLGGVPASPNSWGLYQADNTRAHEGEGQPSVDTKEENRMKIAIPMVAKPSEGAEGYGPINQSWTGDDFGGRIGSALVGLALALAQSFILLPSCLAYLIAVLAFKVSLTFSPVVLLIGVIWFDIVKRYTGFLASWLVNAVTQLIYMGLAINLMIGVIALPEPAPVKVLLLILMAGVLHMIKGPIIEMLSMKFTSGATNTLNKLTGTSTSAVGKTGAVGAGALGGMASAIIHQSRNSKSGKSEKSEKTSSSTNKVARPKSAESMNVHAHRDADESEQRSVGSSTSTGSGTSSQRRQGPFETSQDGTTTRSEQNEGGSSSGTNTRRAEPGFVATETPAERSSVGSVSKDANHSEVSKSAKDERTRVSPVALTAVAGGMKGAVAGARTGSVTSGLTAGVSAGTEASRSTIERAERQDVARQKAQEEKDAKEALRQKIVGAIPQSSTKGALPQPKAKVNTTKPSASAGGLPPRRASGGLPGSGGAPRTGL